MESRLSRSRERVEMLSKDKLFLKRNLEYIDIKNGIDWNYKHYQSASTYQVYLHSLSIIPEILLVAKHDKNEELFKLAKTIIIDWFRNGDKKNDSYAWHEHSVSNRISNIIKFQFSNNEVRLKEVRFQSLLEKHCSYLADIANYKENNHGLMMDEALLNASSYLKDKSSIKKYRNIAFSRIKTSIYRDLSYSGVHLENSPEYHLLYLTLIRNLNRTMEKNNLKFKTDIENILKNAIEFKSILLQPNLFYPMIGDSGYTKEENLPKTYKDFIDIDAGLAIFQHENERDSKKSPYFTFKVGYRRKTHKHQDDLSVTFMKDGVELLIDSGKYSYSRNDEIRKYITSPGAHSTIKVTGESYELPFNAIQTIDKLKIKSFYTNKNYKIVSGINELYEGIKLERICVVTKDNILILIDLIQSKESKEFSQIFNLHEDLKVKKISNYNFEIESTYQNFKLNTFSTNPGLYSQISDGYISREFNKKIKNNKVEIKQNGKEITFMTVVSNENDNIELIEFKDGNLSFKLNQENYFIPVK